MSAELIPAFEPDNCAVFLDGNQLNLSAIVVEQRMTPVEIVPKDGYARFVPSSPITVIHLVSDTSSGAA